MFWLGDGAHIDPVAGCSDEVLTGGIDDVGGVVQVILADDFGRGQIGGDGIDGNDFDRILVFRFPDMGAQFEHAVVSGHRKAGLAVDDGQSDDIAGVDQVKVFNLRIVMPDLRPLPGFL